MNELALHQKDKVVDQKQQQQEKKEVLVGKIRPKKGHTLFEVDMTKCTIVKAKFDESIIDFEKAAKGLSKKTRRVFHKPGCIYVSCLNKKNVPKVLERDFGITITPNE